MHPRARVQSALKVMRTLWAALIGSQVLMLAIVLTAAPKNLRPPESSMVLIIALMGVAVAVASFIVPARVIYAPNALRRAIATGRERSAEQTESDVMVTQALLAAQTALILSVAMSEAVSLFGFTLGWLGASTTSFVPLFATGIVLSAVRMPSTDSIVKPMETALGVSLGV